jgi:hypothetical protein
MGFIADEPVTDVRWKVGDWCILHLEIGQITEKRGKGSVSFSDGTFETSGQLVDLFRPLTLRNKNIVEWFKAHYDYLREIAGEQGFNYPRIASHFENMCREAIDAEPNNRQVFDKAEKFVQAAREHQPVIQGVDLFRPARRH